MAQCNGAGPRFARGFLPTCRGTGPSTVRCESPKSGCCMSAITDELAYKAAYCHMRARTAPTSEITTQWTLMADAWIHMARIHRRLGETQVVPQNLAWTAHDWADGPLTSAEAVPASGLAR